MSKKDSLTLTTIEIAVLEDMINEAATWRGALVGNPDPEPLKEFDSNLMKARKALLKVCKLNNHVRATKTSPPKSTGEMLPQVGSDHLEVICGGADGYGYSTLGVIKLKNHTLIANDKLAELQAASKAWAVLQELGTTID